MAAQNDINMDDSKASYVIKTMSRRELDLAIDWAAAEGWNPGLDDADCFYNADPNGFLMGVLEGTPIASIAAVRYGQTFGFIGLYIVRPEFRGQGYGLRLWTTGMNALKGRTIGLDGVVDQQSNYTKSGFRLAYRNIRYEGIGDGEDRIDVDRSLGIVRPLRMVPLDSLPIDGVIEYDRAFFPDDRSAFLKQWIIRPQGYAIGLMNDQALVGYGVLRTCRTGYKIGPLFADTPAWAEALLLALKAQVPLNQSFYLDVPEVNPHAIALTEQYQMQPMFETARMYTHPVPDLSLNRVFGITTFELG